MSTLYLHLSLRVCALEDKMVEQQNQLNNIISTQNAHQQQFQQMNGRMDEMNARMDAMNASIQQILTNQNAQQQQLNDMEADIIQVINFQQQQLNVIQQQLQNNHQNVMAVLNLHEADLQHIDHRLGAIEGRLDAAIANGGNIPAAVEIENAVPAVNEGIGGVNAPVAVGEGVVPNMGGGENVVGPIPEENNVGAGGGGIIQNQMAAVGNVVDPIPEENNVGGGEGGNIPNENEVDQA
uniref:Uncharacterized protein n=1 Tax=Meloidogyne hapla TaxID=6305 RepID=A0A1I8BDQ3_MELHA